DIGKKEEDSKALITVDTLVDWTNHDSESDGVIAAKDFGVTFEENPFLTTADEGIFDSGYSRSMTGNKERLDDFQAFQGGKVTFGGGEGRITGKGAIRTP
nr:hypothetical protein [Tanacetum cinerariifolium]